MPEIMHWYTKDHQKEIALRMEGAKFPCDINRQFPHGKVSDELKGRRVSTAFAWGFRREFLEKFGLYDRILVDHTLLNYNLLTSAFYNDFGAVGADHETSPLVLEDQFLEPYFDWAKEVGKYVNQRVGRVPGAVLRMNPKPSLDFTQGIFGINPRQDVQINDGMLEWTRQGDAQKFIENFNIKSWSYLNRLLMV